jgi:hypothetical protein
VFALVLDQLFPYGIYWFAFCHIIRSEAGNSLDDWVESSFAFGERVLLRSTFSFNSLVLIILSFSLCVRCASCVILAMDGTKVESFLQVNLSSLNNGKYNVHYQALLSLKFKFSFFEKSHFLTLLSSQKARDPVRSPIDKLRSAGLVVGSVTTSESPAERHNPQ